MAVPSSAQLFSKVQQLGNMPDFKKIVNKKYAGPVMKPLIKEGANLEGQYLPTIFKPFQELGTGAADLTAADKLGFLGDSLGRLESRLANNRGVQDYFGMQINDMIGNARDLWGNKLQNAQNLYGMAYQREQDAIRNALSGAANANAAKGLNWQKYMDKKRLEAAAAAQGGALGTNTGNLQVKVGDISPTGSQFGDLAYGAGGAILSGIGGVGNELRKLDYNMPIRFGSLLPVSRQAQDDWLLAANNPVSSFLRDASFRTGDLINRATGNNTLSGYNNPSTQYWLRNQTNRPQGGF